MGALAEKRNKSTAKAIEEFLRGIPYLSSLSGGDLARIRSLLAERHYAKGDYIFLEGDRAEWCGFIFEGQVKLVKHSDAGKDLMLDLLGPGSILGIECLFSEQECIASAQAMEPTTVLLLAAQDMHAILQAYPVVFLAITRELSRRLEDAYRMMRSLALERVERRVALNLVKLAGKIGIMRPDGSILIDLPLSRQDIADMSGTTIETAIRTMSKFQKEGLVDSEDGKILLLKPHKMVLISEDMA